MLVVLDYIMLGEEKFDSIQIGWFFFSMVCGVISAIALLKRDMLAFDYTWVCLNQNIIHFLQFFWMQIWINGTILNVISMHVGHFHNTKNLKTWSFLVFFFIAFEIPDHGLIICLFLGLHQYNVQVTIL